MNGLSRIAAVAALTTITSLGGCVTVPHGLVGRNGPDTASRVRRAVPDGSTEAAAIETMRAAGYKCGEITKFAWSERTLPRALDCYRVAGVSSRGGFVFPDEYYVVFELVDGRTILVDARIDITPL